VIYLIGEHVSEQWSSFEALFLRGYNWFLSVGSTTLFLNSWFTNLLLGHKHFLDNDLRFPTFQAWSLLADKPDRVVLS
jgi:hypothetical protein